MAPDIFLDKDNTTEYNLRAVRENSLDIDDILDFLETTTKAVAPNVHKHRVLEFWHKESQAKDYYQQKHNAKRSQLEGQKFDEDVADESYSKIISLVEDLKPDVKSKTRSTTQLEDTVLQMIESQLIRQGLLTRFAARAGVRQQLSSDFQQVSVTHLEERMKELEAELVDGHGNAIAFAISFAYNTIESEWESFSYDAATVLRQALSPIFQRLLKVASASQVTLEECLKLQKEKDELAKALQTEEHAHQTERDRADKHKKTRNDLRSQIERAGNSPALLDQAKQELFESRIQTLEQKLNDKDRHLETSEEGRKRANEALDLKTREVNNLRWEYERLLQQGGIITELFRYCNPADKAAVTQFFVHVRNRDLSGVFVLDDSVCQMTDGEGIIVDFNQNRVAWLRPDGSVHITSTREVLLDFIFHVDSDRRGMLCFTFAISGSRHYVHVDESGFAFRNPIFKEIITGFETFHTSGIWVQHQEDTESENRCLVTGDLKGLVFRLDL